MERCSKGENKEQDERRAENSGPELGSAKDGGVSGKNKKGKRKEGGPGGANNRLDLMLHRHETQ